MKKFRGTLIFALLVFIVAGLALWQFKKAPPDEAEKVSGEVLFPAARSGEIEDINFDGSTRKFKLKKQNGRWQILEPYKDQADDGEVNKTLSDIFTLRVNILETGDGPILWEKYGLTDPDETLTLKDVKGQNLQLKIGRVRTYDKGYYLRRGDEPKLIVAASTMASIYNLSATALRERKLDIPGTKVFSYSVTSHLKGKEMQYVLKSDNGVWSVEGHQTKVSSKLVTAAVDAFKDFKADGFELDSKDTAKPAELAKLGLQKPVVEFKIVYENPEGADKVKVERDIKFGQSTAKDADVNQVYFTSSGNSAVYKTYKSKLEGLIKTLDSLRDPKGPFTFDTQKITHIKFVSPDFKQGLVLEKVKDAKASSWHISAQSPKAEQNKVVNEPVVMDFLSNINVLEAMEFFKPGERKFKSDYMIELKDEAKTVIKIDFGGLAKDTKSNIETYLVKSSLSDQTLAVRKASIDKLTKPNLVQNAAEPKKVTEVKKVEQEPRATN